MDPHARPSVAPRARSAPVAHPPSWIDALTDRIDAVRGPSWWVYAAVLLAYVALANPVYWIGGA